jgi:hypothetical protein
LDRASANKKKEEERSIMGTFRIAAIHGPVRIFLLATTFAVCLHAQRITIPLDGTWSVAESMEPDAIPTSFSHTGPVPGLTHSAAPKFPDVDEYHTHEWAYTVTKRDNVAPLSESVEGLGSTVQKRNFFWYERTFRTAAETAGSSGGE